MTGVVEIREGRGYRVVEWLSGEVVRHVVESPAELSDDELVDVLERFGRNEIDVGLSVVAELLDELSARMFLSDAEVVEGELEPATPPEGREGPEIGPPALSPRVSGSAVR